ncbi:MAG: hypothetical protein ACI4SF_09280 [Oscillospiraceae bacterium]
MQNLIKALNYQTRRDNVTIYAVIIGLLVSAMILMDNNASTMTGASFAVSSGELLPMALSYMSVVMATRICGWDMTDKTINYEVLSGHHRRQIYFARVIVSLIWTMVMAVIITALPVLIFSVLNGWGPETDLKLMLIRYAMLLLPLFRLICGYILISFAVGNFSGSAVACFLLTEAELMGYTLLDELTNIHLGAQLALSNMVRLLELNGRMGFVDGKDIYIYDAALSSELAVNTVGFSLTAGIIYLILGFVLFSKRDMR